jgi:phage gp45-like
MHRGSPKDYFGRAIHTLARATINAIKDGHMMQTMHADMFNNDSRQGIERVQNYGFTSSIIPRSKSKSEQQQQDRTGATGQNVSPERPKGEAAEAVLLFQAGQRNHPLAVAVDDRRFRPRLWKPGENAQYDDIGQVFALRRGGAFAVTNNNEDYDGKTAERVAVLGHVEKDKQERPKSQTNSAGQAESQDDEDFKHEGNKINAGVRVSKGRIEFVADDEVVGYYDKASKTWCLIGQIKLGDENAENPVYGVNGGVGMTTKASGDAAVLVAATRPGPPTSQDTQP